MKTEITGDFSDILELAKKKAKKKKVKKNTNSKGDIPRYLQRPDTNISNIIEDIKSGKVNTDRKVMKDVEPTENKIPKYLQRPTKTPVDIIVDDVASGKEYTDRKIMKDVVTKLRKKKDIKKKKPSSYSPWKDRKMIATDDKESSRFLGRHKKVPNIAQQYEDQNGVANEAPPKGDNEKEEGMSQLVMTLLAGGATPMLIGALMGDIGTGAQVGGQALGKQLDWQQKMLMKKQEAANRAPTSEKRRYQTKNIYNPDTKEYEVWDYDTATRKWYKTGKLAGYAPSLYKDPNKEYHVYNKADSTSGEIIGKPQIVPFVKKDGTKYFPKSKHRDIVHDKAREYQKSMNKLEAANDNLDTASNLIKNTKSGILGSMISVMNLVKSVESKITDQDANRYTAQVSFLEKFFEEVGKLETNEVPIRLLKEAKESIKEIRRMVLKRQISEADEAIDTVADKSKGGVDREYAKSKISPQYDSLVRALRANNKKDKIGLEEQRTIDKEKNKINDTLRDLYRMRKKDPNNKRVLEAIKRYEAKAGK